MKIKPEHFAVLETHVTAALNEKPWLVTEYQAAGFTPKLLRWDTLFSRSGISIGDSVGMTCPENVDPSRFLPLYDYADDNHIDTALRAIFSKAGFEYGALKDESEAKPLVITNGSQFTPSGNMIAEIAHCDPETGSETKSTCCVLMNGQVLANQMAVLAKGQSESLSLIDITGEEHSITADERNQLNVDDMPRFAAGHSCYTATTYDLVITEDDIAEGHSPEREDGQWESAAFSFDEIQGEARNHSFSEYDAHCLYSTDPAGTREHYEAGVNRYHYMQIEAVNGQQPSLDQMQALGEALKLSPSPELAPKSKSTMRMSM